MIQAKINSAMKGKKKKCTFGPQLSRLPVDINQTHRINGSTLCFLLLVLRKHLSGHISLLRPTSESLMASGHLPYNQEYLKCREILDYWNAWVLKDTHFPKSPLKLASKEKGEKIKEHRFSFVSSMW